MSGKKVFKKRRVWVIPIAVLVVLVLVVFVVGQFTPVLTALLFKPLINLTSFTAPPNFKSIQENVLVKKDIAYNDHGTLVDIYYPKNDDPPKPVIMWIH